MRYTSYSIDDDSLLYIAVASLRIALFQGFFGAAGFGPSGWFWLYVVSHLGIVTRIRKS